MVYPFVTPMIRVISTFCTVYLLLIPLAKLDCFRNAYIQKELTQQVNKKTKILLKPFQ